MTTYHIDVNGALLKATSDPDAIVPGAVTKTTIAPESGRQLWNGTEWGPVQPLDPAITPLTPEDIERLLLTEVPNMTRAKIDNIKRKRGQPLP